MCTLGDCRRWSLVHSKYVTSTMSPVEAHLASLLYAVSSQKEFDC